MIQISIIQQHSICWGDGEETTIKDFGMDATKPNKLSSSNPAAYMVTFCQLSMVNPFYVHDFVRNFNVNELYTFVLNYEIFDFIIVLKGLD